MLLATLRSGPATGSIELLIRQAGIRHASKSARGSKSVKSSNKTSKVDRASSKASTSGTNNKSSSISSIDNSSSQTANSASKTAAQDSINEVYVKEKVIFETGPNEKVADARVLLGFGFMFCVFCLNGADLVRREPRQPTDPTKPRVEGWPAWKRWGASAAFAAIGLGIGGYCIYWPTRILKKITLIAPTTTSSASSSSSTSPMLGIPTKRLQIRGQPTTPYHSCNVRITTGASYSLPKLFPDPIVPFTKLRLLGPLNDQQKYWHPIKEGNSFSQSAMINGKFPNVTPLHIDGTRITYNMRKENAYFWDIDGLEKALLKNMDMAYEEEQQLAKKAKEGKDAKTPAQ